MPLGTIRTLRAVLTPLVVLVAMRLVVVAEGTIPALTGFARRTIKATLARLPVGELLAATLVAVVVEAIARLIVEAIVAVAIVIALAATLIPIALLVVAALLAIVVIETRLAIFKALRIVVRARSLEAWLLVVLARWQIDWGQRLHIATVRFDFVFALVVGLISAFG